jgi:hypothetical protein
MALTTTWQEERSGTSQSSSEVIHTNKKHPFLTLEQGFLPVGQIVVGMHIVRADGRVGMVTAWRMVPGSQLMENLEVARVHPFTVGSGQWVLHNCNPDLLAKTVTHLGGYQQKYGAQDWKLRGNKGPNKIGNPRYAGNLYDQRYYLKFEDRDGYQFWISLNCNRSCEVDTTSIHFASDGMQPEPDVWGKDGWKRIYGDRP